MRKMLAAAVVAMSIVGLVMADTVTVTMTGTNGQAIAYSNPIQASGYLDKVEVVQAGTASTNTITLATYSGTTAVETFVSLTGQTAGVKVVRPRVLPTANTGTALAGATANVAGSADAGTNSTNTVATTVLSVPYAQPLLGGNMKMAVTSTATASTNVWTVNAVLYFVPTKK